MRARGIKHTIRVRALDALGMAYALPGVSRARSAARDFCRSRPIPIVTGCAPPSTRRAIRSNSSNVATASRTLSSVAPGSWRASCTRTWRPRQSCNHV